MYALDDKDWPGISKVTEEVIEAAAAVVASGGRVLRAVGKLMGRRGRVDQLMAAQRTGEVRVAAFVLEGVVDVRRGRLRSECQATLTITSLGEERRPTSATWAGARW